MPTILVNPLDERRPAAAPPARRLETLSGKALGLLDISKPGGGIFLDVVEHLLQQRYGVARVVREMKPTFTKPAPAAMLEHLRGLDAVIEALAD